MTRQTRRAFMASTAASAAALTLARPVLAQDGPNIRHFWWGNPERDKRTFGVIDVFNDKNAPIVMNGETVGFPDYFPKLTTQIAGRNMPDVIQQGYGAIFEYIERGAILPLDEHIGKTIDLSLIDKSAIAAGTFDGKLYALSIGANSHMAIYNEDLFAAAGIEGFDPFAWTYADLHRIAVAVSEATPEGTFGSDDNTAYWQNFSDFVAQSGGRLYNDDKTIGATEDMLIEYWNIWKDIRDAGGCPPAKQSAGLVGADMSNWGVVTGLSAISFAWSNQLVGAKALTEDALEGAMFPAKSGGLPGQYVQPSQFICLTRDTVDAEAATTYMNAFVNDLDMINILGLERGIPANSAARDALLPNLSDAEAKSVAFFAGIQGKTADLPPPFPSGANEVEDTFERLATGVLLDPDSIEKTAKEFVRQANFVLSRA